MLRRVFRTFSLAIALSCLLTFFAFCAEDAATVVYLQDGGIGNGASSTTPVGTLKDAYAALDLSKDCTVVVCGPFTQQENFDYGKPYTGSVTITSVYGGVDYRESGALYQFGYCRFICNGATVFANLDFEALDTGYLVIGQHHPVTIGEGVSMTGDAMVGGTVAKSFAILGGYESGYGSPLTRSAADTSVTVLSGSKIYIVPFSRNILGDYTGKANIFIGGTADVSVLHGSAAYPTGVSVGDISVTLTDSAIVRRFYGCTQKTAMRSFTLYWESGTLSNFRWNTPASAVLTMEEPSMLYASEKAAGTKTFREIAGNFDTALIADTMPAEPFYEAPDAAEQAILDARGDTVAYQAFRFADVGDAWSQISVKSGYVYRMQGDFLLPVTDADDTENGHMAMDITKDGTYVFSVDPYVVYGDLDRNGTLNVRDSLLLLRIAIGDSDTGADYAAADMNLDQKITLSDVLRQLYTMVREDATVTEEPIIPEAYNVISIDEYMSKTKLGLLSQFVGFLSGYEFARENVTSGYPLLGMPDDWFEMCNGPYAEYNERNPHEDKLLLNDETGVLEVWNDDDFSIDIVNQYILADMYTDYGTVNTKSITDGWINYDVYDMGGGNRDIGAYGLMSRYGYLSVFSGNTEVSNNFNVNGEPYIGNETLGMNAAGMPDLAVGLATIFGSTTSDRDPLLWLQLFTAMNSMAYFEKDVPTLIREAEKILPDGCWQREVIDMVFALQEKYPDDWRAAVAEAEDICHSKHYDTTGYMGETSINCSFILIGLLYGDGDYYETCKIISLAGHGGDSTTPVGLTVAGILCGWENLDDVSKSIINEKVWQDGKGVVVNLPNEELSSGYWMYCANLPERLYMVDILDMYQANFERLLLENGGRIADGNYYIPKQTLSAVDTYYADSFETTGIDGFTATGGTVTLADLPFMGTNSVQVNAAESGEAAAYTMVDGLTVGETYKLTAFVRTTEGVTAHMFARATGEQDFAYVTLHDPGSYITRYTVGVGANDIRSYVRRDLIFTATAAKMEIGLLLPAGTPAGGNASFDEVSVVRFAETEIGDLRVEAAGENGKHTGRIAMVTDAAPDREVLLKLTYSSDGTALCKATTEVNNAWHSATPLAPTAGGKVTIYVPVLLTREDYNSITLYVGDTPVEIHEAKIVTVQDRF